MAAYKFQYLFDKPSDYPRFELWRGIKPGATQDLVFKLCQLADSATNSFMGAHPTMWPFTPDEFVALPWNDEWWQTDAINVFPRPEYFNRISKELKSITAELGKVAATNGDTRFSPFGYAFCSKKLKASKRGLITGHAAQTLMCVDAALEHFLGSDYDHDVGSFLMSCAYENLILIHMECESLVSGKIAMARSGGIARHQLDPKAQDKAFVKTCWSAWADTPKLYKSVESFAKDMLEKTQYLEGNTQVIARWVRVWRRELLLSRHSAD